ncbi:hypothetical protein K1719_002811 [Acacia pycnantha]|nr:hypothetical protein K1719_002811 [Acacia pycnantha]
MRVTVVQSHKWKLINHAGHHVCEDRFKSKSRIKEAVKLFEEMDKQNFFMSEKIKRKLFEWKQEISRLKDLNFTICVLLVSFIIWSFKRRWRSTTKSECTTEQGADNIETKKLSEENKLLRDMKFRQQREVSATEEMKVSIEAERKI